MEAVLAYVLLALVAALCVYLEWRWSEDDRKRRAR